ncbi:carcinoembryonic antigen-related cell adhesion molecule 20-like isoform X3 [Astyanax mexicanus]|uniref:Carcinoembryonic antigen-related cell adhesion molecule 20-like isoform X3 n=1 Tax=Astyanax mexicanus TaxID=7994 RepID=A0A8T2LUN2_ASTMX|nr:carcinoembryonic antigen-related cell adhesion molecule 20-like isoform X3 [Astyanax mexicanus]
MMAARALCCALMLLLCGGVCSGENLILPSKLQNATQETALFKPIKLPTDTYNDYIWRFGSLTIVNVVGTLDSAAAAYKNRISLDKTTLALELRNLTLNDSGEYVLSINGDKGSYTATTRLEVFEPVTSVTIIPNTTELIEFNSTVSLNCSASGSALSFVWLNGSSEITEGERVVLSDSNKTLTVSNVNRHEGGPYTCEASNAISRAKSEPQTLSVNYGPDIAYVRAVPSGPLYSSGSEVFLTCSADSSPAAEYQWALDGSVLSDEGQKLTLTDIQTTDNGSYTCIAHNTKTLRYSTSQTINITVVERISGARLIGPSDLIMEGNSTTLTCEGNGTVDSIKWFKNNESLSPSSSITFSSGNRSVTISPIRRADRGDYNCTLINPVSSGSAAYRMIVNFGPDSIRVDGRSEVEEEGYVNLSCIADSEPVPLYKWEFNGTKTEVTSKTYIVNSAKFSDSGNYTCIARNNITKLEATASRTVVVKEKGSLTGGSLSPGAIAGIVIGVLLGVAGVGVALIFCLKKRPKSSSKEDKQNGVAQNGGEHELNYAEVRHVQPDQSVVNMGGPSTQTRHGTPAMVRANRGAAPNQGVKPPAPTEVTYSEVKK